MIGCRCLVVTDWSNSRHYFGRLVRVRSNNLLWFVLFLGPWKSSTAADYRLGSLVAGKLVQSEVRRWVSCWKWDKSRSASVSLPPLLHSALFKFNPDAPAEHDKEVVPPEHFPSSNYMIRWCLSKRVSSPATQLSTNYCSRLGPTI